MKTVCELDRCSACKACLDICPRGAISVQDTLRACNAVIDPALCVECGLCHKLCQQNCPPQAVAPRQWYQGWAEDEAVRSAGSSGGVATALALAFVENGGQVCGCTLIDGKFRFMLAKSAQEVRSFTGSRYVKSDPEGIYPQIKEQLKAGQAVLFIGLPCQTAAVRNYVGQALGEALCTVDLICHGSPSPKVLDAFLAQHGHRAEKFRDIQFRDKTNFRVAGDRIPLIAEGVRDRYTLAFLNGLCYTENCYHCGYARLERVSDVTLGDSWGSELPQAEQRRGVSLILCQTEKGAQLVENSGLRLLDVDLDRAVANNHQLQAPSKKPAGWEDFLAGLESGSSFDRLVKRQLPKQSRRQDLKRILLGLHIIKPH